MEFQNPLIPATLIKRYKRFLADVRLEDGLEITVHCPNPGSMMGLKEPGSPIWLSDSKNPKRKLRYTLEVMRVDGALVGINTNIPNKLAEEAILVGTISELSGYPVLRREVKYGENSRIDILLEGGEVPAYVEIKNVHLMRTPGLAEFPDSVTMRGARHLAELTTMVEAGARAVMLYIVQRADCDVLAMAADIDPAYDQALKRALAHSVEVLVYRCTVGLDRIVVDTKLPFRR